MPSHSISHRILQRARAAALLLSTLLSLTLSLCYALRPDAAAAVTVWPVWVWLLPGLALLGLGSSRATRRAAFSVSLLWLLYLAAFAEEPRSLLRAATRPHTDFQAARARGDALRIVSLNCAGGSAPAVAEANRHQPDIVMLQEAPPEPSLLALARELFGGEAAVLRGPDAAVIVRGQATAARNDLATHFVSAHLRLTSGLELNALSIRLHPPILRADLWSPDAWRAHRSNRRLRRDQINSVAQYIANIPDTTPIILAGDFNAPPGDAAVRSLRPRLHDTFTEAGRGWGNTVLNDFPVLRFDQVWASDHFRTIAVHTEKTRHSDHRMVICDLVLRQTASD